jgi:hypothetical protein
MHARDVHACFVMYMHRDARDVHACFLMPRLGYTAPHADIIILRMLVASRDDASFNLQSDVCNTHLQEPAFDLLV